MFFTIRNNLRPIYLRPIYLRPIYLDTSLNEYIKKTNHYSIKKNNENYMLKKNIYNLINYNSIDNPNNKSLIKYYNDSPIVFSLFTITTFGILYSFVFYNRFKK